MRVGLVVDGKTEYETLNTLLNPVARKHGLTVKVLKADFHPLASHAQIVKSVATRFAQLEARGFRKRFLLLDRETSTDCAPRVATGLLDAASRLCVPIDGVAVKDRCYENWLIADPDNLASKMPARFKVTNSMRQKVVPNKADHVEDAVAWLNRAVVRDRYDKVRDAERIVNHIAHDEVARNSRSFRHLLRLLE